jgi:acyl-CoA thioester hydrolase
MYFYYEVLDADGNKLNEGETTLVFINMSSNRPCKAPEYLLKKLSPYFE